MGLDMYLFKAKRYKNVKADDIAAIEAYLSWENYFKNHPLDEKCTYKEWCGRDKVPSAGFLDFYREEKNITNDCGYWRKANAIHQFFVDQVQNGEDDCEYYEVSKDDIELLRDNCKTVLADHSEASCLLPTTSGFFFGSTDYDEWYFKDLEDTIKICNIVLETVDFENEILIYCSSW